MNLSQNVREGWTNSYWKRHVLMFHRLGKKDRKTLWRGGGGVASTPLYVFSKGKPTVARLNQPRFQKYFSVSCNCLQLWERYVTRNIITISEIEFAVVQLKDKAPPRNKSCHLYFGGKNTTFLKMLASEASRLVDYIDSRLQITRTFKGNRRKFELSGVWGK